MPRIGEIVVPDPSTGRDAKVPLCDKGADGVRHGQALDRNGAQLRGVILIGRIQRHLGVELVKMK